MEYGDSTENPPYRFDDPVQRSVLAVCIAVISAIGIPGNLLVVFAVCASRKLQTTTNAFVVNLAISDLISCVFIIFHPVALFSVNFYLSETFFCKIIGAITYITLGASIVNLALIAVNRLILITRPRSTYDKVYCSRNVYVMIFLGWLYVIIVATLPPALGFGALGFSHRYSACTVDSEHPKAFYNEMLRSILIQFPCLVVIIACYYLIYRFLKKKGILREIRRDSYQASRGDERRRISRQIMVVKITKNLFLVVCAYIVCIMPFAVACVIPESYVVIPWFAGLVTFNSCVNPLIYGFNHPQFKEIFNLIFTCKCKQIPEPTTFMHAMTVHSES
ncbi:melatonin receptor type 1C-like [Apostichopus japonicus]|uniref:melatonin receptor type 1C-like n=1 Tax=Stichopus japonicus TaxID=307972 RepID=UPI003AB5FA01